MTTTREWWPVKKIEDSQNDSHCGNNRKNSEEAIRIFDWNILAPHFVYPHLYRNIDPSLLQWNKRVFQIIDVILSYKADIITLQELPQSTFQYPFLSTLRKRGYDGYFVPKSFLNGTTKLDGVATFWKTSRFHVIEKKSVSYNVNGLMDRPQVAGLVLLEDKVETGERLIVANTHLLFNVNCGHLKLGQLQLLMLSIWRMIERWCVVQIITKEIVQCYSKTNISPGLSNIFNQLAESHEHNVVINNIPGIVMCGDYNLTPNSCLYQWIRYGRFEFSCPMNIISGQRTLMDKTYKIDPNARETRGSAPSYTFPIQQKTHKRVGANVEDTVAAIKQRMVVTREGVIRTANPVCNTIGVSPRCVDFPLFFYQTVVVWIPAAVLQSSSKMLMSESSIQIKHNEMSYQPPTRSHTIFGEPFYRPTVLYHPFCWRSSYARRCDTSSHMKKESLVLEKEPAYTAYHGWQKGCIDYIWYSINELKVDQVLEFPRLDVLDKVKNIPHQLFPGSDHFFLVVDLLWTTPSCRVAGILL